LSQHYEKNISSKHFTCSNIMKVIYNEHQLFEHVWMNN